MWAGEVRIKGVSNIPMKPIRIIVAADYISNLEQTIVQTKTDFKGRFEVVFNISETVYAQVAAGLQRAEMLIKPGCEYSIELSIKSTDAATYFDPDPLTLKILQSTDNGTGKQIETINFIFNAFVMQYFDHLYRFRRVALLDTLKNAMEKAIPKHTDEFVAKYLFYKFASLDHAVRNLKVQQSYQRLFQGRPILYGNPEYMSQLKLVYQNYLIENKYFSRQALDNSIIEGKNALDALVSIDPILKTDKQLRELLIIMQLNNYYFNPDFPLGLVHQLLGKYETASVFAEHRAIASNIKQKKQLLASGSAAPDFVLSNSTGNKYSVASFDGLTLLNFVQNNCLACESQLLGLKQMFQNRRDDYQIVTIATKESFAYYDNYFKKHLIDWTLLNLGEEYLLLEAYNIKSFPENIILLPQGKIGMAPAPDVDQNLEYHLNRIKFSKKK